MPRLRSALVGPVMTAPRSTYVLPMETNAGSLPRIWSVGAPLATVAVATAAEAATETGLQVADRAAEILSRLWSNRY